MLDALRNMVFLTGLIGLMNQAYAEPPGKFPVLKVNRGSENILLVGSNHTAPSNIFAEQAEQVLAGAKSLCLEVIPSEQDAITKTMLTVMLNTTGRTLAQRHGAQLADDVARALTWAPLIAAKVDNFSDQTLGAFLWLLPPAEQFAPPPQMRPDYSIDAALLKLANQRNLKLRSIEDPDAIPNSAAGISQSEWADYLRKSVELSKCRECRQEFTKHMAKQYTSTTDYEAAYQEAHLAFASDNELFDYFDRINLRLRNHGLARNIYTRALIQSECNVVAVGSAHLGGPNGIVSLLRKMGATVTPFVPVN